MNILFTCVGRRTYLLKYFRENLSPSDLIIATDMSLSAPALQIADVKIQVPSVYSKEYIEILLTICVDMKIDALISLNDLELPILAYQKKSFTDVGTRVIVSDAYVIDLAFDKFRTAEWVTSLGLKSPITFVRLEDAKLAIKKGKVNFPLILKPRWGSGSIGIECVDDMEELEAVYSLLLKKVKKTILSTVSSGNEYILIQEKLTGREYGLDVINDLEGRHLAVSVKQKLGMRSGETDKAITVDIPEITEIGKLVGCKLGHIANLDVDIMQRDNGDYCVLELNPRFGGGYPFSHEAGVNLPKAIIEWLNGRSIDISILQPKIGKKFAKNDYLMPID